MCPGEHDSDAEDPIGQCTVLPSFQRSEVVEF